MMIYFDDNDDVYYAVDDNHIPCQLWFCYSLLPLALRAKRDVLLSCVYEVYSVVYMIGCYGKNWRRNSDI
jgi:hypothetical protein